MPVCGTVLGTAIVMTAIAANSAHQCLSASVPIISAYHQCLSSVPIISAYQPQTHTQTVRISAYPARPAAGRGPCLASGLGIMLYDLMR